MSYLKTLMVLSVTVVVVGIVIQEILLVYESDIDRIKRENPTIRLMLDKINHFPSIHQFLASVLSCFPSFTSLMSLIAIHENPDAEKSTVKDRLFTAAELKEYDGREGSKGLYLAILGRVFDVRKGVKHYGPGGGYEFFAGRDASRAYVSGDFSEAGLNDDITGLSSTDYIGLDEWLMFYDRDYNYVGKLIGRYYDERGQPTQYYLEAQRWISEAYSAKEMESQEKKMFPPCNSEWNPDTGPKVWCTKMSGGIKRDWVGVPRQLFTPGKKKPRCACIKNSGPPSHDPKRIDHLNRGDLDHPNLQEYPGCASDQAECQVKEN